jgi:hypothetical protein
LMRRQRMAGFSRLLNFLSSQNHLPVPHRETQMTIGKEKEKLVFEHLVKTSRHRDTSVIVYSLMVYTVVMFSSFGSCYVLSVIAIKVYLKVESNLIELVIYSWHKLTIADFVPHQCWRH